MMKLTRLLLLLLLVGCGGAAVKRPSSAKPEPAAAPGTRATLVAFGLSAEFPGVPKAHTLLKDNTRSEHLSVDGQQSYSLSAFSTMGRDRPPDANWFEGVRGRMKLEKRGDVQLGAFDGQELAGKLKERHILLRVYAVADTLVVAEVDGKQGPIDEPAARRFLDSVQLELPWRIYASATTKFSVMVPSHAVEVDQTEAGDQSRSITRAFFVGGRDQRVYWTTAQELGERNSDVSDDQILDAGLAGMQEQGAKVTWQAPLQATEARGREFLGTSNGMSMMGRIWLTEHFIYLLMITAKSREALQQAETSKFYGSLVWY